MAACGRVCDPNGSFAEAKQENRWLAVRPLWSELAGRFGSVPAIQAPELVARSLPVELGCHKADVRLKRIPTQPAGRGLLGERTIYRAELDFRSRRRASRRRRKRSFAGGRLNDCIRRPRTGAADPQLRLAETTRASAMQREESVVSGPRVHGLVSTAAIEPPHPHRRQRPVSEVLLTQPKPALGRHRQNPASDCWSPRRTHTDPEPPHRAVTTGRSPARGEIQ